MNLYVIWAFISRFLLSLFVGIGMVASVPAEPEVDWRIRFGPLPTVTANPQITVHGMVTADGIGVSDYSVLVNGTERVTNSGGFFYHPTTMVEGTNTYVISMVDEYGDTISDTRDIVLNTEVPQVTVNSLPTFTNQNQLEISGSVTSSRPVTLLVNGMSVEVTDGNFEAPVDVVEGLNTFTIEVMNDLSSSSSIDVSVTKDSLPPALNIAAPENVYVNSSSFLLEGSVSDSGAGVDLTLIRLNGAELNLGNGDQTISQTLTLIEGVNAISVVSEDLVSNIVTKEFELYFSSANPTINWLSDTSDTNRADHTVRVSTKIGTRFDGIEVYADNEDATFEGNWPSANTVSGFQGVDIALSANELYPINNALIDNTEVSYTGTWNSSTSNRGYIGPDYRYALAGPETESFVWPIVGYSGKEKLFVTYSYGGDRSAAAKYLVQHVGGSTEVFVNQQEVVEWVELGEFELDDNSSVTLFNAEDGYVIADAVIVGDPEDLPYATATYSLTAPKTARYRVDVNYTQRWNRNPYAQYKVQWSDIHGNAQAFSTQINQVKNGGEWHGLGHVDLLLGESATVTINTRGKVYTVADGIRLVEVGDEFSFPTLDDYSAFDTSYSNVLTNYDFVLKGVFKGYYLEETEHGYRGMRGTMLALDKYMNVNDQFEYSAQITKLENHDFMGLAFRTDMEGNGYLVEPQTVGLDPVRIYLMRLDNGIKSSLGYVESSINEGDVIGVQVEGNSYQIKVNGQSVGDPFVDSTYQSGRIGVAYHWGNIGLTSFDNISVKDTSSSPVEVPKVGDFITNYDVLFSDQMDGLGFESTDSGVRGLGGLTFALDNKRKFSNDLMMSVELVKISNYDFAGLVLRADEKANGYLVLAKTFASNTDELLFYRAEKGVLTLLALVPVEMSDGDRFGVVANGNSFQLTHNEMPVGDAVVDEVYSAGKTGIAYLREGSGEAIFDNLHVKNLDISGLKITGYAQFSSEFEVINVGEFNGTKFVPKNGGVSADSGLTLALEKHREYESDLSISVEITEKKTWDFVSVVARANENGDGYLVWAQTVDGELDSIFLKRMDAGVQTTIGRVKRELVAGDRFGLIVEGDSFHITVNEKPVGPKFYDATYSNGRIGVAYLRHNVGGTVFNDIAVKDTSLLSSSLNILAEPPVVTGALDHNGSTIPFQQLGNELHADITLVEGANALTATVTNTAGNQASRSESIVLDTVPPSFSMSPIPPVSNQPTYDFIGTASGATALVFNYVQVPLVAENFSFSYPMYEGFNPYQLIAFDDAGNLAELKGMIVHDATAPEVVLVSDDSPTNISNYLLKVQVEESHSGSGIASVRAVVNSSELPLTYNESTSDFEVSLTLMPGSNSIEVHAIDNAGNASSLPVTKYLDTTAPLFSNWNVPLLTNVTDLHVSVTVTEDYGNIALADLQLNGQSASVQREVVDSQTENWTSTVSLLEGDNQLVFTVVDSLNNQEQVSFTINLDTSAPSLSVAQPVTDWQASIEFNISGSVSDDNSGVANLNLLFEDSTSLPLQITADAFNTTISLSEGSNPLDVAATDQAGNTSIESISVGVDLTEPVLTLTSSSNIQTNLDSVTLQGTAADVHSGLESLTIIYDQNAPVSIPVVDGAFTFDLMVSLGSSVGVLTAMDNVGHQATLPITVNMDNQAPQLTTDIVDGVVISDSQFVFGISASDEHSSLATLTVTVNGIETAIDVEATALTVELLEGSNTVSVAAVDALNNETTLDYTVVLDTQQPQITWLTSTNPQATALHGLAFEVTDETTIENVVLLHNSAVVATTLLDGQYQASVKLAEGTNTFTVEATDAANNVGTSSVTVELDSLEPVIALNPVDSLTGDSSVTISGSVTDASASTLMVNNQGVVIENTGVFTTSVSLTEGENTVTLIATDALNNQSIETVDIVSDQSPPSLSASVPPTSDSSFVTVSITATDAASNVQSITVENTTTGLAFDTFLLDESTGAYEASVLVASGTNSILVTAIDDFNKESSVTIQTEYVTSGSTLTWLSHQNNDEVLEVQIVLEALLETNQNAANISASINQQPAIVTEIETDKFSIKSQPINLNVGVNDIAYSVTAGDESSVGTLAITHLEEPADSGNAPIELTINSPAQGTQFNGEYLTVSGSVKSDTLPTVTIDGLGVSVASDIPYYHFSVPLQKPAGQSSWDITIEVATSDGQNLSETRTVYIDNAAPTIHLDQVLQPYPTVNEITSQPFVLSGNVSDLNFNSLSINGNVVTLTPASENSFEFNVGLALQTGVETNVQLIASDTAGNQLTQTYVIVNNQTVELSWLLPLVNSQFLTQGEAFDVQAVVQSTDASVNQYQVRLNNLTTGTPGNWQAMQATGNSAVAYVTFDGSEGQFELEARALNALDEVIAQLAPLSATVTAPEVIELAVTKTQPENGDTFVDTKDSLAVFFNKAIDPAELTVNVFETAYGKTWINLDAPGTEFFNAKGHQLVDVQRDYEAVPVDIQVLDDSKSILIHPQREPAYGATMFIEIAYEGEEKERFQYLTKPLPTLITMKVRDQFNRNVDDLIVKLGDATTRTKDGFAQFGFAIDDEPLTSGDYSLHINPGLADPRYGETNLKLPINGGRLNELGTIPVSFLNPEVGSSYIKPGETNSFLGGDLEIGLNSSSLTFKDGSSEGNIHVQFNSIAAINYPVHPVLNPNWAYSFQPLGIVARDTQSLKFRLPKLNGTYNYLPDEGSLGLLLGVNSKSETIEPIGIARRAGDFAVVDSVPNALQLDHLSVVFLGEVYEEILSLYNNGTISRLELLRQIAEKAQR